VANWAWNDLNPAMFLVLFGASEAYQGINSDDQTGCQLMWVDNVSASIIPHHHCYAVTNLKYPDLDKQSVMLNCIPRGLVASSIQMITQKLPE